MGLKRLRKYTDRELINFLEDHIRAGWSVVSFPASLKVTQTSFYQIIKEKPYFASYYRRVARLNQKKSSTFVSEACSTKG